MSYLDNLETYDKYGRRSVYEILSLNPNISKDFEILKTEYRAVDIDKVIINGNTYTNYGAYSFIWEKSYIKSPVRSGRGNIGNLNSYPTFLTGHFVIDFSIISIDDYRSIMRQHYEQNEFTVECYDPIYNKKIKLKMYFATEEMAKLYTINKKIYNNNEWEDWILLAGVQDYQLEMISTNNELDLVSIVYHLNPPNNDEEYPIVPDQTIAEPDIYKGEEVIIGSASKFQDETFGGLYKFTKWTISPNEKTTGVYLDGYSYTINNSLVLYAQWEPTTEHTLTFNYGIADPAITESEYSYETKRTVKTGEGIKTLPVAQTPIVKAKDINGVEKEYADVYSTPQWWKVPQKVKKVNDAGEDISDTLIVNDNEPYWTNRDATIYLLYNVTSYQLNLYLDGTLYQSNKIEYNTPMNLPILVRSGYTFDGWYTSSDFKQNTKISGNMPPYALSVYARWVENK